MFSYGTDRKVSVFAKYLAVLCYPTEVIYIRWKSNVFSARRDNWKVVGIII